MSPSETDPRPPSGSFWFTLARVAFLAAISLGVLHLFQLTPGERAGLPLLGPLLQVPAIRDFLDLAPMPIVDLVDGYLSFLFAAVVLYHLVPARWRAWALAAMSVAYFWIDISHTLTAKYCLGMVAFYGVLLAPVRGWSSFALFLLWNLCFYTLAPLNEIALPHGPKSLMGSFGENVVVIGLFVRTFRRATFAYYEMRVGRIKHLSLSTLLNYMIGLPFLIGHSATPSLRHFIDSEALTPDAMREAVSAGARNFLVCFSCLLGWFAARYVQTWLGVDLVYRDRTRTLESDRGDLIRMILGWHLWYYLRRMSTEQMSVATFRLFGHNIKDDFAAPLRSRSVVEYWRRWNALWREFLVSAIYYPVVLRLARRYGTGKPWIYAASGFLTFMGGTIFDFFPRLLFFVGSMGPEVYDFMFSLLLYHISWSCCLAFSLYLQARRGNKAPLSRWWMAPLEIAATYSIASLCRVFEIPWLTVSDKLAILWMVFGG